MEENKTKLQSFLKEIKIDESDLLAQVKDERSL
jgi:hypothetical protein